MKKNKIIKKSFQIDPKYLINLEKLKNLSTEESMALNKMLEEIAEEIAEELTNEILENPEKFL